MFATVSKVEAIGNPLKFVTFLQGRRTAHQKPLPRRAAAASRLIRRFV